MLYWPEEILLKVQLLSLWGSDTIFMSLLLLLLMFAFFVLKFSVFGYNIVVGCFYFGFILFVTLCCVGTQGAVSFPI